jgi:hypothetical protein
MEISECFCVEVGLRERMYISRLSKRRHWQDILKPLKYSKLSDTRYKDMSVTDFLVSFTSKTIYPDRCVRFICNVL